MRERAIGSDELEQLRRWGEGLRGDPREEVAAAGRAIVLLVDEVERLAVNAWNERLYGPIAETVERPAPARSTADASMSLLQRLRLGRRQDADNPQDGLV